MFQGVKVGFGRASPPGRVNVAEAAAKRTRVARTPLTPRGKPLRKAWRSLGSPTPDTAAWGPSSDVPVWRDREHHGRECHAHRRRHPWRVIKNNRLATVAFAVRSLRESQFRHGSLFHPPSLPLVSSLVFYRPLLVKRISAWTSSAVTAKAHPSANPSKPAAQELDNSWRTHQT